MHMIAERLQSTTDGVMPLLTDYAELTKLRITSLIMMNAWCGYFFGAQKAGVSSLSWTLLHALLGIGIVSSGTAALNEVMERDVDALMQRTARRPLPAGRMSVMHATVAGMLMTVGGTIYLLLATNWLTAVLTLATAVVYLAAYTPLKRISPICTFVGAFPGAMPGLLGWVAIRGRLDWGALVLFTILFLWQFPHFLSIACLYRDDYARGGIRMLPVLETDGRSTGFRVLLYSLLLIPASLAPFFLKMTGQVYFVSAAALGVGILYFSWRLARFGQPLTSTASKARARQLLQATVYYLPLLLVVMVCNS